MAASGALSQRLRTFLKELGPAARKVLREGLERARTSGQPDPIHDMVLKSLRGLDPETNETAPAPSVKGLVFRPLQSFVVDNPAGTKVPGRIERGALDTVWVWFERDAATDELYSLDRIVTDAVAAVSEGADIDTDLENVVEPMRRRIAAAGAARIAEARQDSDQMRRLVSAVGSAQLVEELDEICTALEHANRIEEILAKLPTTIDTTDAEHAALVAAALTQAARENGRLAWYVAWHVHDRCDDVGRLPQLARQIVTSADVRIIASAPAGRLVDTLVSDIEVAASKFTATLAPGASGDASVRHLREYNNLARQLRSALDIDVHSNDWSRRLAEVRTSASAVASRALQELPTILRRAMKSLRAFGNRPATAPDPFDVARAATLLELFDTTRLAARELAMNELTIRIRTDVESYVEMTSDALIEDVRAAPPGQRREIALAHCDAALKLIEALHGEQRSSLLRQRIDVAAAAGAKVAS